MKRIAARKIGRAWAVLTPAGGFVTPSTFGLDAEETPFTLKARSQARKLKRQWETLGEEGTTGAVVVEIMYSAF